MSVEKALSQLVTLPNRMEGFSLAFGVKTRDDGYEFRKGGLADRATEQVRNSAVTWIQSLKDLTPVTYQVSTLRHDTELDYIQSSSVVGGKELISQLTPTTTLPSLGEDDEFLQRAKLTVVTVVGKDMNQATLFRKATSAFLLRRSGSKIRLHFNNGVFNEVSEEIIQIDREYDCVAWEGYIFIKKTAHFEDIFDYRHLRSDHAQTSLNKIADAIGFDDPECFVDTFLNDRRYYRKIQSVINRRIFERVPITYIEQLVKERELPITFKTNSEGKRVFVFDSSVAGRKALMALLDDDHLSSPLTRTSYEANSKHEWKTSS